MGEPNARKLVISYKGDILLNSKSRFKEKCDVVFQTIHYGLCLVVFQIKPCTNYGVSSTDERCACLTLADCPTLARGKGSLPVITVQDCGHCYNVLFADP